MYIISSGLYEQWACEIDKLGELDGVVMCG